MFRSCSQLCSTLLRPAVIVKPNPLHQFSFVRSFRASANRYAEPASTQTQPALAGSNLTLRFVTPHETIINNKPVYMVSIPCVTGVMGVLGEHAPTIAELQPGLVTVHTADLADVTHQYLISAGFALIRSDSTASVTAVEAIKLEDLDAIQTKHNLDQAQAQLAKATTDEDRAQAEIAISVYEAVLAALENKGS